MEKSDSTALTIASVQKSNEGNHCCVISNIIDSETFGPAKLSIGKRSDISLCQVSYFH